MNGSAETGTKLIWPGLAGFYGSFSEIAYTLMRVVIGYIMLMHGWGKINAGAAGITAYMAKNGLEPGAAFAYAAMFLETVGAVCIILGLFTRFFAAALAIEMALITFVYMLPQGWGRMEPTFIWGIVMFAIALRGGGPYSLDRKIGKEL